MDDLTRVIDILLVILITLTLIVPFALFILAIRDPAVIAIAYNRTYLWLQITGFLATNILILVGYLLAPQKYHTALLFLLVGVPAVPIYYSVLDIVPPPQRPHWPTDLGDEHGSYDGDYRP